MTDSGWMSKSITSPGSGPEQFRYFGSGPWALGIRFRDVLGLIKKYKPTSTCTLLQFPSYLGHERQETYHQL